MRLTALTAPLILTLGTLAGLAVLAAAHAEPTPGLADRSALVARGPIEIESDADFTAANGVRRGSGTPGDPFVIADWQIVGSGEYGLEIERVSASWVIENVLVDGDDGGRFTDAIYVANVTNGMIEHVEARSQVRYGIYLDHVDGVAVCEVFVVRNGDVGLYASKSNNMTWEGNFGELNRKHGFYLAFGSSFNRITRNRSNGHTGNADDSFGIYSGIGANDNVIDNNTLVGNGAGLQVTLVERNVIRDNVATDNVIRGISLLMSDDVTVSGNTIAGNHVRGIMLGQSKRTRLEANVIENQETGIFFNLDGEHVITRNLVRGNALGIHIAAGEPGSLIYDNLFSNTQNARDDMGLSTWNVSKRDGPNVIGGRLVGGNFWSDAPLGLHDHDEDGLYESHGPYSIGIKFGGDWLPIATAPGAPVAGFDLSNDRPESLEAVTFTDASVAGSFPIVNWSWDFGDGARAFGPVVRHAYREAGNYGVVLRVRDQLGLVASASRLVVTQNLLPVARLAGDGDRVFANVPVVTFDASPSFDPDGAVKEWRWTFGDGTTASGRVVTHAFPAEGSYAAALLVVDNRLGSAALPILVVLDFAPPVTVAAVEGPAGNNGWYRGPATMTLLGVDPGSGVRRSEWRLAGEETWSVYVAPFALGDGDRAIEYRSVDRAGNAETPRPLTVRVDGAPPATARVSGAFTGPDAPVVLLASDATSGVARTFYRIDGERSWRVYDEPFHVWSTPEGVVAIEVASEDAAGNAEVAHAFVVVHDRTPPTARFQEPSRQSVVAAGTVVPLGAPQVEADAPPVAVVVGSARVRLEAADALAGLGRVSVIADGVVVAEAVGVAPEVEWRVPPGPPASHVLRLEARDAVGNLRVVEEEVWGVPLPEVSP